MNRVAKIIETAMDANVNLMLWGGAGIGKTSVIHQVAEAYRVKKGLKKFRAICLMLSQMDAVEIGGYPKAIKDADGKDRCVNLRPWWFPLDDEPVLLFLDELNRADKFAINAVHQLALEKSVNIHKLPEGSMVMAACNYDDETECGLTRFGEAFIERFSHIEVNFNVEAYLNHAKKAGNSPEVIGFIESNPAFLCKHKSSFHEVAKRIKPSPRCWDFVNKVKVACGDDIEKLQEQGFPIIAGLVGSEPGMAFMKYIREQFERPLKYAELVNGRPETTKKLQKWCNDGKIELLKGTLDLAIEAIEVKWKGKDIEKSKDTVVADVKRFFEMLKYFPKDTLISVFSEITPDKAVTFGLIVKVIPIEYYKFIRDFEKEALADGEKEKSKKDKK